MIYIRNGLRHKKFKTILQATTISRGVLREKRLDRLKCSHLCALLGRRTHHNINSQASALCAIIRSTHVSSLSIGIWVKSS